MSVPPLLKLDATHLISSPYIDFENQLDLQDVDVPHRLFAFALTSLKPVREDYATAPYLESFNWSEVFSLLRELCQQTRYQWRKTEFYVVIFRSTLLPDIDRERIGLLDQKSHQEACASGGLLKYWFGSCDSERRNLATCELDNGKTMGGQTLADFNSQAFGEVLRMLYLEEPDHGIKRPELLRGPCMSFNLDIDTSWLMFCC